MSVLAEPTKYAEGLLNVAARVASTEAEGPGVRFALWVQGCPLRCEGCCNPHMLEDKQAQLMKTEDVLAEILATPGIEGVTLIGGEPFWQAAELSRVARGVREAGLSVMVFSGLTLGYLRKAGRADFDALLEQIDLLIDGPYVQSKRVLDRRWIGSSNQRAHYLTERYRHLEESGWDEGKNTVEIRMVGGEISINGWPDLDIVSLSAASIKPVKRAGEG
jgi:anaerobic ribonucleoside-triphosphate reductase activating protein